MTQFLSDINQANVLGATVPDVLDMGCDRHPNILALNRYAERQWQTCSNLMFRRRVEELALGFSVLALEKGDRLAMLMHSDFPFALVDFASLLAGFVNVPIDLTQTIENIFYCLNHSEAKALVISDLKLLDQLLPYLAQAEFLRWIIVANTDEDWEEKREKRLQSEDASKSMAIAPNACLHLSQFLTGESSHTHQPTVQSWPHRCIGLLSLDELQTPGEKLWSEEAIAPLKDQLQPKDLATIIYIASEDRQPKGVMLSHENMTSNALTAFSSYPNLKTGDAETVLLFLPLTHIFARVFLYGHLAYGHSLYFSSPTRLIRHLRMINPTILITVPRLLEKIYERVLAKVDLFETKGLKNQLKSTALKQAVRLAHRYDVSAPPRGLAQMPWEISRKWVFSQWQDVFGTKLHALICGGAALKPELVNFFNGSGIPVIQGYGLTETSGVVCYNRKDNHRADTVGLPMPFTEIKIAGDREILIKAPFVMQGYYKDPVGTAQVMEDGWLHTGDIGGLTPEGFLRIKGVKKAQFKLATGKYVSLKPLENAVQASELVQWAIAVGMNQKFCGMLIFPERNALIELLNANHIDYDLDDPQIIALYQNLVNQANCHLPYWSNIRKFTLMEQDIPESFMNADGTLSRSQVYLRFASDINKLYQSSKSKDDAMEKPTDLFTPQACPTFAQSLMHS
ncbi:Long-chain-fatty-acid--CoA ligase [[Leptolyngbya] sp. PCC 7376]|uniref:AMP-dependent synthetase/ligase n=1 Tax=[Leptolyngbya] sp. PCC 7376 TaxID=111781 RepID=UPI00029F0CBE|nr:AMP-binding protein [[Leptolyngbya] sp. PCC 7376]AFY39675.1 Long-chain-fatty-acid--CoA ligase [[Leptolyngbya] sp. PCC 7376]